MARTRTPRQVKPNPTEPARKIAYGYVRVSTDEQVREGVSLDAQRSKIRAYATLHDFELREIFSDDGKSAKDIERPQLKRLMTAVEGPEEETVIVYKLDRLTRSTRDLLWLIEVAFKNGNTRFISLSEQIDTSTASGKFFLTMMGGLAQMERELISERTRAALDYKRQRGDRLGTTPMGYITNSEGQLVPHKEELRVVRRIRAERRRGKGLRAIAAGLNAEGIPTKRGRTWKAATVDYIAKNGRYASLLGE